MTPSKRLTASALACLTAAGPLLQAQLADDWMPVVSKIRRTVTKIPSGSPPEVTETWDGRFFRSRDGSQMQTLERVSPSRSVATASFIDRPAGRAYRLDYSTRTAVLSQDNVLARADEVAEREMLVGLGRQEIAVLGVPCFVIPVTSPTPGVSGQGCYSPEHDLHLYWEVSTTDSRGLTVRHRTEHYDLEIGRAPDAGSVRLPDGFVVQEGLCEDCGAP